MEGKNLESGSQGSRLRRLFGLARAAEAALALAALAALRARAFSAEFRFAVGHFGMRGVVVLRFTFKLTSLPSLLV